MYIYKLTKNKKTFYIGRTQNIKTRYSNHIKKYGKDIEIEIIDSCDYLDSMDLESFYIKKYLLDGYLLLNKHTKTTTKLKLNKLNKALNNPINDKILSIKKIKLIIPPEYKKRLKSGDIVDISNEIKIKYTTVYHCLIGHKCHKNVFDAITKYIDKTYT